jgi:hypothetical protein
MSNTAPFTAIVSGEGLTTSVQSDLFVFGAGFAVGLETLVIAPNRVTSMTFDPGGRYVTLSTDDQTVASSGSIANDGQAVSAALPKMVIVSANVGDNYEFSVQPNRLAPGSTAKVTFAPDDGTLRFEDNDGAPVTYGVKVVRLQQSGVMSNFVNNEVTITGAGSAVARYATWDGAGSMSFAIDGKQQQVANQRQGSLPGSSTIYLPAILR